MKEVDKIAITAILRSVDKDILVRNVTEYLMSNINDDSLRIAAILSNKLPMPTEIPQHSKVYNKFGTFKAYNHFTGTVEYLYNDFDVLYFKTEQDAKAYSNDGTRKNYSYIKSDEYSFEAKWSYEHTDYCNYETWLENAISDEKDNCLTTNDNNDEETSY